MKKILLFAVISFFFFLPGIAQNSCGLSMTATSSNVKCYNTSTASIDITVTGGSGKYTYYWVSGPNSWNTQDLTNVPAGNYSVYVYDATNTNCSITQNFEITEPDPLEITSLNKLRYNGADLSCSNSNDGRVAVSVMGGTYPYNYSLNGSAYQSSYLFTGLPAGTYYATVKDANGCLITNDPSSSLPKSEGWIVPPAVLNAPAPLVTDSITVTPSTVLSTGTSSYTIYLGYALQSLGLNAGNTTGGTGTYSYSWSPLIGLASSDAASVLASPTTTTTYTVTISDVNGCSVTRSVTINVIDITGGSDSGTGGTSGGSGGSGSTSGRVMLCHNGFTIWVSKQAIAPHIAHGDFLGPCSSSSHGNIAKGTIEFAAPEVNAFNVAPNPSKGKFNIDLRSMQTGRLVIEVYNATGILIETRIATPSLQSFNMVGRSPGIYYIKVKGSGDEVQLKKIILQ